MKLFSEKVPKECFNGLTEVMCNLQCEGFLPDPNNLLKG